MAEHTIDISCRYKDYTAEVTINRLPANDDQISGLFAFLDFVKERKDVSVIIRMNDEQYVNEVPQAVLLADSPDGFYMELDYSKVERKQKHPFLLANDHLTKEEAVSVLISIFYECTDDIPVITCGFQEISSRVFSNADKDKDES